jgi:hypothetical protein
MPAQPMRLRADTINCKNTKKPRKNATFQKQFEQMGISFGQNGATHWGHPQYLAF